MKITAKVKLSDFVKGTKALRQKMPQLIDQAQLEIAIELEARMKESAQQRLRKDPTGALLRSIRTIRRQGYLAVGTDRVYAQIQDEGGTVYPTREFLAIPKEQPKSLRGKWPRDYARGELFRPGRRGDPNRPRILIHKATGRVEFVLAKKAVIPSTRWFSDVRQEMATWGRDILQEVIETGINEAY